MAAAFVRNGHEVYGQTRSEAKAKQLAQNEGEMPINLKLNLSLSGYQSSLSLPILPTLAAGKR